MTIQRPMRYCSEHETRFFVKKMKKREEKEKKKKKASAKTIK
jgi:hypothetical protein